MTDNWKSRFFVTLVVFGLTEAVI